jgi:hypothetical protein
MDYLADAPCMLEALAYHLNNAMAWLGCAAYQLMTNLSDFSCYQCAGELGWILADYQCYWCTVSWLFWAIMVPAAFPTHLHQRMGGRSEGSMASLPAMQRVTKLAPSLACPPLPAHLTMATASSLSHPQCHMGGEYGRVDGTLACYTRGLNAISKPSRSSFVGSSNANNVVNWSLSTTDNRKGGGHCGRTPCHHNPPLLVRGASGLFAGFPSNRSAFSCARS